VTTRTLASALAIMLATTTAGAQAQQTAPAPAQPAQQAQPAPTGNPLTAGAKRTYDIIKNYVTKAAAKMPDEHYAFKPTPEVRSFGQLVGHIADANFGFCSAALGEKAPMGGFDPSTSFEKTKTTKADLEKALADSFAYCDKAHAAMNDTVGAALVKLFSGEMAKLSVLEFNTHHDFEHYGNMVTYMRLKGLVPPSSEPRGSR
jgi:uncharacterized damage-inducible protein DinB